MMDEPPDTRRSLIVKLRDPADTSAWGDFVAIYEPLIYRLARRKGLQDADAHDLCQEVFRAVARAVEAWDPARGSFRAWLSRIARNLLINFLTRGRSQPRGSGASSVQELLEAQPAADPSATALFEAEYERNLFLRAADEARAEFAPTTWQAFWQTAVEGRPPAEVAAELRMSVGAVYVARSRVLARLRRRVEQLGDAEAIPNEADHEDPIGPV
jgi:RNA polymerase sigma-70 factor (ECF subfamily)